MATKGVTPRRRRKRQRNHKVRSHKQRRSDLLVRRRKRKALNKNVNGFYYYYYYYYYYYSSSFFFSSLYYFYSCFQKSASVVKTLSFHSSFSDTEPLLLLIPPLLFMALTIAALEYSPTRRSKKLVFPCRLIISIQLNGF